MTAGAVIMIGAGATTAPERLVLEAQRAATLELIRLLQPVPALKVILSSPEVDWVPLDVDIYPEPDSRDLPFHFGTYLADLAQKYALDHVLYFGGGSAPRRSPVGSRSDLPVATE